MRACSQPQLFPGRFQGGGPVIEIEEGEVPQGLLLLCSGGNPHADVLEACGQMLNGMVVACRLVDPDYARVGDERAGRVVELCQVGSEDQG